MNLSMGSTPTLAPELIAVAAFASCFVGSMFSVAASTFARSMFSVAASNFDAGSML